jgi:hypothetical protein
VHSGAKSLKADRFERLDPENPLTHMELDKEIRPGEVRPGEVWRYTKKNLRSPVIPPLHPLLQLCKMFLARHRSRLLCPSIDIEANLLDAVLGMIHDTSAATVPMSCVRMHSWMWRSLLSTTQHWCWGLLLSHCSRAQSGR